MTGYVGVDYSSRKVALVHLPLDKGHPIVKSFEAPRRVRGMDAMRMMLREFSDWCCGALVLECEVLIESPVMGVSQNIQTAVNMSIAAGALYQCSIDYGATSADFVSPASWKKYVTGKGNSDKDQVMAWLREYRPDLEAFVDNQDECDAMCLALLCKYGATSIAT